MNTIIIVVIIILLYFRLTLIHRTSKISENKRWTDNEKQEVGLYT